MGKSLLASTVSDTAGLPGTQSRGTRGGGTSKDSGRTSGGSEPSPFWIDPGGARTYIEDHDLIFWFGDLNYRVDAPREKVLQV